MNKIRCLWAKTDIEIKYHDEEWGVIVRDEKKLFELLILEGMQAGLSWNLILKKRDYFKEAFHNFDYNICSKYDNSYLDKQLNNENIIRNKLKIYSVRKNAIAFLKIQEEFGSFFKYIWNFVDNKQIINFNKKIENIPTKSALSTLISKDLKKRGFNFVGETIVYSYLQAIGIINDHLQDCHRYEECKKKLCSYNI